MEGEEDVILAAAVCQPPTLQAILHTPQQAMLHPIPLHIRVRAPHHISAHTRPRIMDTRAILNLPDINTTAIKVRPPTNTIHHPASKSDFQNLPHISLANRINFESQRNKSSVRSES